MSYYDIKFSIYEKCRNGIITESEKDRLLRELDTQYSLPTFCENYGLIPVDDDTIIFESIKASLGKFIRDKIDMKAIKSKWNEMADKFIHNRIKKTMTPNEKIEMQSSYDVLKKPEVMYFEYKKHFAKIAKFVDLTVDDIILEHIDFDKDDDGNDRIKVGYSKGKQQVIIPNGTCLLHVSPVKGIKELKPAFRSKTVGKYMYPSPRCFFTLGKAIKPTKAGLENKEIFRYTPCDLMKMAYIDPTYTDFKTGAVYIETSMPIKVMDFDKKMEQIFKENTDVFDVDKYRKLITESYKSDLITSEQATTLFEYLM